MIRTAAARSTRAATVSRRGTAVPLAAFRPRYASSTHLPPGPQGEHSTGAAKKGSNLTTYAGILAVLGIGAYVYSSYNNAPAQAQKAYKKSIGALEAVGIPVPDEMKGLDVKGLVQKFEKLDINQMKDLNLSKLNLKDLGGDQASAFFEKIINASENFTDKGSETGKELRTQIRNIVHALLEHARHINGDFKIRADKIKSKYDSGDKSWIKEARGLFDDVRKEAGDAVLDLGSLSKEGAREVKKEAKK
ncbi:uncharacterized protein L969DRAFT_628107 [Mixia osmundae IAM 14324]|uniref:Uncharacterized protein n=1 Tax=Mixia osmundae (strain CBS 9802 / IAM 14324 / JCM 22182 / KY 12970) TaxID=764103 RepID=G7DSC4_MIXOS|nr:uncharacterized protein L969DRAFT_628107 [Mixia osmundae IAM 14324]KEI38020.1 hypothetical protein L969DRAFT_628107 [Mixia osmundae IAM 14324]GAA93484.1 hypothetical protein E5Q_00125 [Mixia osmundae IAM 14324]